MEDTITLVVSRFHGRAKKTDLKNYIQENLPNGLVVNVTMTKQKKRAPFATIKIKTNTRQNNLLKALRRAPKFHGNELDLKVDDTYAKELAKSFHSHVNSNPDLLERSADREDLGLVFQDFLKETNSLPQNARDRKQLESRVFASLRSLRLLKSKRFGEKVVTTMARSEGAGDFPPMEVRKTERERVLENHANEALDKEGVSISYPQLDAVVPSTESFEVDFSITATNASTVLNKIKLGQGYASNLFKIKGSHALPVELPKDYHVVLSFKSSGVGLYRAVIRFEFFTDLGESFTIARFVRLKSGDPEVERILQPVTPYEPRRIPFNEKQPDEIVPPPPPPEREQNVENPLTKLPYHRIPKDFRELLVSSELANTLVVPEVSEDYEYFWKQLVWASEFQAYQDIKLFDMIGAKLDQEGRYMKLHVPGLAEGRPSVLRGDLVGVTWNGTRYQGRVSQTRLLEILMEFDGSFHRSFNTSVDRVDVRFTFTRTTFRTSHEGCSNAESKMGDQMLFPSPDHAVDAFALNHIRPKPETIRWANRDLNSEQMFAVKCVLEGACRPLPFIIFGPPGTGKSTTVVEAVYQLAHHESRPNILLIAPSNDAADVLVEKLSSYFPPSQMCRVLAYSRSTSQMSAVVQEYAREGLEGNAIGTQVTDSQMQIVVSTVNLAARFSYYGVPKGHFEVLCVDEAGHCSEPEVVAVASTLFDFQREDSSVGQLVLAGDPRQLGPVITSELCRKFGLGVSYMERLTNRPVYGRNEVNEYPPDLMTKLVNNYRSHPSILKLPNEMFYEDELVCAGDTMATHNMAKWEHLPTQKFPIIFHSMHGENLREGNSPSWFNPQEAEEVLSYIKLLTSQTKPPVSQDDIGIITPYARQVQKIRLLLEKKNFSNVKVGSVETFQGQERRCIIISTVRANTDLIESDLRYNLGFVANEKRFNVAVTRAKSLLIVIGDPNVLSTDTKNWLPFMRYVKENGGWKGESWDENAKVDDDDHIGEASGQKDPALKEEEWDVVVGPSAAAAQEATGFINREE